MIIKIFTNLAIILALGMIQISFLSTWPKPISLFNLILILIIFLTLISRYQQGLWLAFGGGLFLDLFSFKIFGLTTLSLILTIILINFLFHNFFTNYSFYSLTILGVIGTLGYNLIVLITKSILIFFGVEALPLFSGSMFLQYLVWQLFLNLVILYVIFFIFLFFHSRLKVNISAHEI